MLVLVSQVAGGGSNRERSGMGMGDGLRFSVGARRFGRALAILLWAFFLTLGIWPALPALGQEVPATGAPHTVIRTTVRRVVLDVTVTDAKGAPVAGLTKDDFRVTEDGKPQEVLSFEANGFTPEMDYLPPSLPPQPPNTFMNLPRAPEKGPLYVLLYDLVDMDDPGQMTSPEDYHTQVIARQQMLKFIQSKPEGARFAIFVRSDGLHLVQGFTADKAKLVAALDPHNPKPHIPRVFLMGPNYGRGNRLGALDTLHRIALYLDGLPGRKNLIWFSGMFPLSLFAEETDGPHFRDETKATLDLLAHNQIAVFPVDARGVPLEDAHTSIGTQVHTDTVTSPIEASGGGGGAPGAVAPAGAAPVQGDSAVAGSFNVMDGIARETGGRAFYGTNDVASELVEATESGGVYYTLSYAPSNPDFNGDLRSIHVDLAKKGYQLAYRRSYYGTELPSAAGPAVASGAGMDASQGRQVGDALSANMEHGAPTVHQLVFVVQARADGVPEEGTPAQMAELATEPAYFKTRGKAASAKPLAPIPLQKIVFNFEIPTRQFKDEPSLDLEVAAAAYDADGEMVNAFVRVAKKELHGAAGSGDPARFFRVEQTLEVPVGAVSVRFAVRDTINDRTGAVEVPLPLAPVSRASGAAR